MTYAHQTRGARLKAWANSWWTDSMLIGANLSKDASDVKAGTIESAGYDGI
jgi:hypothetical protein